MRLERSRAAAAAPPPARRTSRAEGPVHPRKREHSVSAARVARSPRLLHGERDPEDVAAAAPPPPKRSRSLPACSDQGPTDVTVAPPPAPRDEAPVPLPNQRRPRTAYALRNRLVPDTSNREPYVPARYKERYLPLILQPCNASNSLLMIFLISLCLSSPATKSIR
jgi:hypothetical protein